MDKNGKTPEVTTPEVKTPEVKTPEVKTPEVTTPEVKTPEVKTPEKLIISSTMIRNAKKIHRQYEMDGADSIQYGYREVFRGWLKDDADASKYIPTIRVGDGNLTAHVTWNQEHEVKTPDGKIFSNPVKGGWNIRIGEKESTIDRLLVKAAKLDADGKPIKATVNGKERIQYEENTLTGEKQVDLDYWYALRKAACMLFPALESVTVERESTTKKLTEKVNTLEATNKLQAELIAAMLSGNESEKERLLKELEALKTA